MDWGYEWIRWTQQFSPALDLLFKMITTLGAEHLFLLLLPLIYWCVDKRRGMHLGLLLMLSAFINALLKDLLVQPRPLPDRVKVLAEETSPGLPSGHWQNSVAVYGFIAAQVTRPWAWFLAGLVAFSVGLSRIYLGVHFPTDVLGGWLVGMIMLALYLWLQPGMTGLLWAWPWNLKLALAVLLPLAGVVVYATESSAQALGVVLGMFVGVLFELRWVRFSIPGPVAHRVLRFLIGGAILIGLWLGLKVLFGFLATEGTMALALRFVRYAVLGAWTSLGAPLLFVHTGLARRADAVVEVIRAAPAPI